MTVKQLQRHRYIHSFNMWRELISFELLNRFRAISALCVNVTNTCDWLTNKVQQDEAIVLTTHNSAFVSSFSQFDDSHVLPAPILTLPNSLCWYTWKTEYCIIAWGLFIAHHSRNCVHKYATYVWNILELLQQCINTNGAHLSSFVFKKWFSNFEVINYMILFFTGILIILLSSPVFTLKIWKLKSRLLVTPCKVFDNGPC